MADLPALPVTDDGALPVAQQYARAERLVAQLQAQWSAAGAPPVERIETHISWVLLTATEAYKFKKPVQLGFLDFGSRAARAHACAEELRVNRRLAPGLYLDVVAFRGAADAPITEGTGPVLEYAVRMRRFAPEAVFDRRLALGRLSEAEVDALARRIARFHAEAEVATPAQPWGQPAAMAATVRATLARLADTGADCADLNAWAEQTAHALASYHAARLRDGRVREGHGDLHLANLVVLDDGPTAFDAIEFDPGLRWIDVMTDFAFALMDFMARGRDDLAWRALDAYLEASGDFDGLAGLRYDLVYRAAVRAMVARLRDAASAEALSYLACARRCRRIGAPPALVLMRGWSGSGKSTLAQGLLAQIGAVRVRSDVERKRLHGVDALAATRAGIGAGIYTADASARTRARLAEVARGALAAGWRLIVDATHCRRDERQAMRALARAAGVPFAIVECRADSQVLRERVRARRAQGCDPSEADQAVLEHQMRADEALDADELREALIVATDQPIDFAAIGAALNARLASTPGVMAS
jgi:uncharacterized protein